MGGCVSHQGSSTIESLDIGKDLLSAVVRSVEPSRHKMIAVVVVLI